MDTAFATGHAAGVAAALTADRGDAETAAVREELRRQTRDYLNPHHARVNATLHRGGHPS
ncbi:hypothetical protein [Actinacidiphila oryziradicis]|uniref:hypothetical protein n=1 Tax=Actinacidiphila oryziradicis TaxID=2571141 RepID=UPI0023F5850A|nr:hypothetical protein [Actinacidiphila oryziradicis]